MITIMITLNDYDGTKLSFEISQGQTDPTA